MTQKLHMSQIYKVEQHDHHFLMTSFSSVSIIIPFNELSDVGIEEVIILTWLFCSCFSTMSTVKKFNL